MTISQPTISPRYLVRSCGMTFISFFLISSKGSQCITQEFCVKSQHLIRLICKPFALFFFFFFFYLCSNEILSLWLLFISISLHLCPWQLPLVHAASHVLFVLLTFFWIQNNHGFREIITASSVLECWHG